MKSIVFASALAAAGLLVSSASGRPLSELPEFSSLVAYCEDSLASCAEAAVTSLPVYDTSSTNKVQIISARLSLR